MLSAIACGIFLFACQQDPASKIPALEQALETAYSPGKADSLVDLYLAAVKAHPTKHAEDLHYLTKAAEIKLLRKNDHVGAARLLDKALIEHGNGQDLSETITVLTQVQHAYLYKSAPGLSRNPDDIDQMHANLSKNLQWIDSSLVRLDKEMGSPAVQDKAKAELFIEVAETYAAFVQNSNPDKSVDLYLKAAGLAKTIGNPNKALQLYYNVGEKMPEHYKAPTALFMMAFIYENDLHQLDKAKETYEDFLKRYPNDPDYADDAQNALKFLGKSAEEIIREFEKNPQ